MSDEIQDLDDQLGIAASLFGMGQEDFYTPTYWMQTEGGYKKQSLFSFWEEPLHPQDMALTPEDPYTTPPEWAWQSGIGPDGQTLPEGAISWDEYGNPYFGEGMRGFWNRFAYTLWDNEGVNTEEEIENRYQAATDAKWAIWDMLGLGGLARRIAGEEAEIPAPIPEEERTVENFFATLVSGFYHQIGAMAHEWSRTGIDPETGEYLTGIEYDEEGLSRGTAQSMAEIGSLALSAVGRGIRIGLDLVVAGFEEGEEALANAWGMRAAQRDIMAEAGYEPLYTREQMSTFFGQEPGAAGGAPEGASIWRRGWEFLEGLLYDIEPVSLIRDSYVAAFLTSSVSRERKKDIMRDNHFAARISYTSWIEPAVREDYIRMFNEGWDAHVLVRILEDPFAEMVGGIGFDPVELLTGTGIFRLGMSKAGRLANATIDVERGLGSIGRVMSKVDHGPIDDIMRNLDVANDLEAGRYMDDLVRETGVWTETLRSGTDELAMATGVFAATARGSRNLTEFMAGDFFKQVAYIFKNSGSPTWMDDSMEYLRSMALLHGDDAERLVALESLMGLSSKYGLPNSMVFSRGSGTLGLLMRQAMTTADGTLDSTTFLKRLQDIQKLNIPDAAKIEKLQDFVDEQFGKRIDDMFPTITEKLDGAAEARRLRDAGEEIPRKILRLEEAADKLGRRGRLFGGAIEKHLNWGPRRWVDNAFAALYLGISPGYWLRNTFTNTLHTLVDAGIGAYFDKGRWVSVKEARRQLELMYEYAPNWAKMGIGEAGGLPTLEKLGIDFSNRSVWKNIKTAFKNNPLTTFITMAQASEQGASIRLAWYYTKRLFNTMLQEGRALPSMDAIRALDGGDAIATRLSHLMRQNYGNIDRAIEMLQAEVDLGRVSTFAMSDDVRALFSRFDLDDYLRRLDEGVGTLSQNEALRIVDDMQAHMDELADGAKYETPHLPPEEQILWDDAVEAGVPTSNVEIRARARAIDRELGRRLQSELYALRPRGDEQKFQQLFEEIVEVTDEFGRTTRESMHYTDASAAHFRHRGDRLKHLSDLRTSAKDMDQLTAIAKQAGMPDDLIARLSPDLFAAKKTVGNFIWQNVYTPFAHDFFAARRNVYLNRIAEWIEVSGLKGMQPAPKMQEAVELAREARKFDGMVIMDDAADPVARNIGIFHRMHAYDIERLLDANGINRFHAKSIINKYFDLIGSERRIEHFWEATFDEWERALKVTSEVKTSSRFGKTPQEIIRVYDNVPYPKTEEMAGALERLREALGMGLRVDIDEAARAEDAAKALRNFEDTVGMDAIRHAQLDRAVRGENLEEITRLGYANLEEAAEQLAEYDKLLDAQIKTDQAARAAKFAEDVRAGRAITPEGARLVQSVRDGGVPTTITSNMRRILLENGISAEDIATKTPNELIDMLELRMPATQVNGIFTNGEYARVIEAQRVDVRAKIADLERAIAQGEGDIPKLEEQLAALRLRLETLEEMPAVKPVGIGEAEAEEIVRRLEDTMDATKPAPSQPLTAPWTDDTVYDTLSGNRVAYESRRAVDNGFRQLRAQIASGWTDGVEAIEDPRLRDALMEWINNARPRIAHMKAETQEYAKAGRDFALLNYVGGRINLDSALSVIYPFHYWHSRTYINWMKRLFRNPEWVAAYAHYRDWLERRHADQPDWWKYQLNTNDLPGLDTDNPIFFNFEATLNPMYNLISVDFDDPHKRTNWFTTFLDDLSKFGPQPHTLLSLATAFVLYQRGEEEAAAHWGGRLTQFTAAIRNATSLLGVGPPGGVEVDPAIWMFSRIGNKPVDVWTERQMGKTAWTMLSEGVGGYTMEDYEEAFRLEGGELWDMILERTVNARAAGQLSSFFLGQGFKPRTKEDIEIDQFYKEWYGLWAGRPNLSPDEFETAMARLRQKYPYMDLLLFSRRADDEREGAYAYNVLGRLPPGGAKTEILEQFSLPYELVEKFYESKGDFSEWAEADERRFMAAIVDMGAMFALPTDATRQEWDAAKSQMKTLRSQMEDLFGEDIHDKIDVWYELRGDDQASRELSRAYLNQYPEVEAALDFKASIIANNPTSLLATYYGGLEQIENYYKGLMYAEIDRTVGDMTALWAEYWMLESKKRKAFWNANPEFRLWADIKDRWEKLIVEGTVRLGSMLEEGIGPEFREGFEPESLAQEQFEMPVDPWLMLTPLDWAGIVGGSAMGYIGDALNGFEIPNVFQRQLQEKADEIGLDYLTMLIYILYSLQNTLQTQ